MSNNSKFSFKFLGVFIMEMINYKPNHFIKLLWHIAFIVVFVKGMFLLFNLIGKYFGM